ncbi:hypothetical protein BB560_000853 [Smittium megazygosporum]|uniref:Uncharacterized protein n=1 Tax=Smittium megazygosporum TaxID=133381 RepID=A0A2T9ZJ58_9FUNG|nr:hypothetical protein BB560_000853 [Smittium megazygosporum]
MAEFQEELQTLGIIARAVEILAKEAEYNNQPLPEEAIPLPPENTPQLKQKNETSSLDKNIDRKHKTDCNKNTIFINSDKNSLEPGCSLHGGQLEWLADRLVLLLIYCLSPQHCSNISIATILILSQLLEVSLVSNILQNLPQASLLESDLQLNKDSKISSNIDVLFRKLQVPEPEQLRVILSKPLFCYSVQECGNLSVLTEKLSLTANAIFNIFNTSFSYLEPSRLEIILFAVCSLYTGNKTQDRLQIQIISLINHVLLLFSSAVDSSGAILPSKISLSSEIVISLIQTAASILTTSYVPNAVNTAKSTILSATKSFSAVISAEKRDAYKIQTALMVLLLLISWNYSPLFSLNIEFVNETISAVNNDTTLLTCFVISEKTFKLSNEFYVSEQQDINWFTLPLQFLNSFLQNCNTQSSDSKFDKFLLESNEKDDPNFGKVFQCIVKLIPAIIAGYGRSSYTNIYASIQDLFATCIRFNIFKDICLYNILSVCYIEKISTKIISEIRSNSGYLSNSSTKKSPKLNSYLFSFFEENEKPTINTNTWESQAVYCQILAVGHLFELIDAKMLLKLMLPVEPNTQKLALSIVVDALCYQVKSGVGKFLNFDSPTTTTITETSNHNMSPKSVFSPKTKAQDLKNSQNAHKSDPRSLDNQQIMTLRSLECLSKILYIFSQNPLKNTESPAYRPDQVLYKHQMPNFIPRVKYFDFLSTRGFSNSQSPFFHQNNDNIASIIEKIKDDGCENPNSKSALNEKNFLEYVLNYLKTKDYETKHQRMEEIAHSITKQYCYIFPSNYTFYYLYAYSVMFLYLQNKIKQISVEENVEEWVSSNCSKYLEIDQTIVGDLKKHNKNVLKLQTSLEGNKANTLQEVVSKENEIKDSFNLIWAPVIASVSQLFESVQVPEPESIYAHINSLSKYKSIIYRFGNLRYKYDPRNAARQSNTANEEDVQTCSNSVKSSSIQINRTDVPDYLYNLCLSTIYSTTIAAKHQENETALLTALTSVIQLMGTLKPIEQEVLKNRKAAVCLLKIYTQYNADLSPCAIEVLLKGLSMFYYKHEISLQAEYVLAKQNSTKFPEDEFITITPETNKEGFQPLPDTNISTEVEKIIYPQQKISIETAILDVKSIINETENISLELNRDLLYNPAVKEENAFQKGIEYKGGRVSTDGSYTLDSRYLRTPFSNDLAFIKNMLPEIKSTIFLSLKNTSVALPSALSSLCSTAPLSLE